MMSTILTSLTTFSLVFDIAVPWQMNFQTPATNMFAYMVELHHDMMFFLIIILVFVLWLLMRILYFFNATSKNKNNVRVGFHEHTLLEQLWVALPTLILISIAVPSLSLLFLMDGQYSTTVDNEPQMTVKILGNQWYWKYENHSVQNDDGIIYSFESRMMVNGTLGSFRLLEVDHPLWLPMNTRIRLLITSTDVIHSFAIPSFGIKLDACPGRLNEVSLVMNRMGTFYGQCSELCGVQHSFMPISVKTTAVLPVNN